MPFKLFPWFANQQKQRYQLIHTVSLCFRLAPIAAGALTLLTTLSAMAPTIQILAFARFVDASIRFLNGRVAWQTLVPPLSLVLMVLGYQMLSGKAVSYFRLAMELRLRVGYEPELLRKCASLQYRYLEDPKTCDLMYRITKDAPRELMNGFFVLSDTIKLAARITGIMVIIATQSFMIALAVMALAIPLTLLATKAGRTSYATRKEASRYQRQYESVSKAITGREYADERSVFGYTGWMSDMFHTFYHKYRKLEYVTGWKNNMILELGSIITCILVVGVIALLLQPLFTGALSAGFFMALVAAVFELIEIMSWDFTGLIERYVQDASYRRELAAFHGLDEDVGALLLPRTGFVLHSLAFRNVFFQYPGTDRPILQGLSFTIDVGETCAFVGKNGSGKTTIVKLLCGLYSNYTGEILINGRELREYSADDIKGLCAVVFQDFARFEMSLRENILIGFPEASKDLLDDAMAAAGLTDWVNQLPNGLDTSLGRLHDKDQDASGGEWQRIAIARGFINPAPLCILDEPTAALDPLMESRLYENLARTRKQRTTFLISHRLGSTKLADRIFVIDDGAVVEAGTHDALMQAEGLYRTMYDSQRRWYA